MKMVSMKCDGSEQKPEMASIKSSENEYPYGLKLYLDHSTLKKLGIEELPEVGSKMKIQAVVEVCSTNESESKLYGENCSMDLQITEMAVSGGGKEDDSEEGEKKGKSVKVGGEMKPDKMYPLRTIE